MSAHRAEAELAPRAPARDAGKAKLAFACDPDGDTYLAEQFAAYPFHICRPHRYDGDPPGMATVTLQSLSGGVYQGEQLSLSLAAAPSAQAHITTQASSIVHSMEQGSAAQSIEIVAKAGSLLEYMPNPSILFPRARFASKTMIIAHPEASVLLSDSYLVHDPAQNGEGFDWLLSDLTVCGPDGQAHARDRFRILGDDFQVSPLGRVDHSGAQGIFFAITRAQPNHDLVAVLREALDAIPNLYAGASKLPGDCGAWARVLASDGASLSQAMGICWQATRLLLTGTVPPVRRK